MAKGSRLSNGKAIVKIREQFITFLMIFDVDIFQDFTAELKYLLPNRLAERCVGECCFIPLRLLLEI